jgi:hypothetical protein
MNSKLKTAKWVCVGKSIAVTVASVTSYIIG